MASFMSANPLVLARCLLAILIKQRRNIQRPEALGRSPVLLSNTIMRVAAAVALIVFSIPGNHQVEKIAKKAFSDQTEDDGRLALIKRAEMRKGDKCGCSAGLNHPVRRQNTAPA